MKYQKHVFSLFELRRNVIVILITTVLIAGSAMLGSTIVASGRTKASDTKTSYKYYTSIEIEAGDSLWSIASEYMTEEYDSVQEYVDEVKALNGLVDDKIHSGQYLTIPYYSYKFQ